MLTLVLQIKEFAVIDSDQANSKCEEGVILSRIVLLFGMFLVGVIAQAAPKFEGEWIQGGLLFGQVAPGSQVEFMSREVRVDDQGRFVIGVGRDTPANVVLTVTDNSGQQKTFEYSVKQRDYVTQRIEGVEQKYVAPPPEVSERIREEAAKVWHARQTNTDKADFMLGFTWPLIGPITGVYGSQRIYNGVPKRPHYGLDIAGPVGATVTAPAPGVITLAHNDMYFSGGTLIIDHGQGVSSTFIHLSRLLVKEGDEVERGEPVAEVGAGGRATGPHLDWRINWFDERLDPALLLPEMPESDPKKP